jgi:hypothetical protein
VFGQRGGEIVKRRGDRAPNRAARGTLAAVALLFTACASTTTVYRFHAFPRGRRAELATLFVRPPLRSQNLDSPYLTLNVESVDGVECSDQDYFNSTGTAILELEPGYHVVTCNFYATIPNGYLRASDIEVGFHGEAGGKYVLETSAIQGKVIGHILRLRHVYWEPSDAPGQIRNIRVKGARVQKGENELVLRVARTVVARSLELASGTDEITRTLRQHADLLATVFGLPGETSHFRLGNTTYHYAVESNETIRLYVGRTTTGYYGSQTASWKQVGSAGTKRVLQMLAHRYVPFQRVEKADVAPNVGGSAAGGETPRTGPDVKPTPPAGGKPGRKAFMRD